MDVTSTVGSTLLVADLQQRLLNHRHSEMCSVQGSAGPLAAMIHDLHPHTSNDE